MDQIESLVEWMIDETILWDDDGVPWFGHEGERTYGRQNFLNLLSVFNSPPLFAVRHGRDDLGHVDEMTFLQRHDGPCVLQLGGRAWKVNHIDWKRRVAYVEAVEAKGRSRWTGNGVALGYDLCQAMKRVLATDGGTSHWSRRAQDRIEELRGQFPWLDSDRTAIVGESDAVTRWWTFGGNRANTCLSNELSQRLKAQVQHDDLALTVDAAVPLALIENTVVDLREVDTAALRPAVDERAADGLKFSECLPGSLIERLFGTRLADPNAVRRILDEAVRVVSCE